MLYFPSLYAIPKCFPPCFITRLPPIDAAKKEKKKKRKKVLTVSGVDGNKNGEYTKAQFIIDSGYKSKFSVNNKSSSSKWRQ